jgi:predicted ATPase
MNPDRARRLREAFDRAVSLEGDARERALAELCAGDAALRREVEDLLARDLGTEDLPILPLLDAIRDDEAGRGEPSEIGGGGGGGRAGGATPVARPATAREFRWGHLLVLERVGQGGFGEVYRALDPQLDREVALKLVHLDDAGLESSARRFLAEARRLASVRHPNVVAVHGAAVHDGRAGIWTDFVRGRTLEDRLATDGPLGAVEAIFAGLDLCRALAAVHAAGAIHGDVKTTNVMREEGGRILLVDFGAARPRPAGRGDAPVARRRETLFGTPHFLAPELVAGEEPTPASDLYALGVVLYRLVSGRYPLPADTLGELLLAHERAAQVPLRDVRADLPAAFIQVVERALAPDPGQRFASGGAMERALLSALGEIAASPGAATRPVAIVRGTHAMPAEPDAFVGRAEELDDLDVLLGESGVRLLTLVGAAGMGKTRLALRFAWRSLATWPGGTYFCDLTAASTTDGIVSAVGGALGVALTMGDPVEQLGNVLAARGRCLVVLDNGEQVTDPLHDAVRRWLVRAPDARFLVTTRERLRVPGEEVLAVEPLPPSQGVELFVDRARRHRPELDLEGEWLAPVREIVRAVEGIPLAIELAAARVRVMTPDQIANRMRELLRLLGGGREGRHESLRAAFDGSWETLPPWEKAAWAQCSVFEGGFDLEAAANVVDLSGWVDAPWVVDVIQSLVERSLLRAWTPAYLPAGGSRAQPTRFGMYASLRDYAAEKLAREAPSAEGGTGEAARGAAEARHGAWFARAGTVEAIHALSRSGGVERKARLALELDNLLATIRRACARQDGETAARAYHAAWEVFQLRGPFAPAIAPGEEVLRVISPSAERLRVLNTLGLALFTCGRVDEAAERLRAGLDAAREAGDRRNELWILSNLGSVRYAQGHRDEARAMHDQALALAREIGDRQAECRSLYKRGGMRGASVDERRADCEAALAIARELGDLQYQCSPLSALGIFDRMQGRPDDALARYAETLDIARRIGHRSVEGVIHNLVATIHDDQGRESESVAGYEAALAIARETGDRVTECQVLNNIASVHFDRERLGEARTYVEAALAIAREMNRPSYEGGYLGLLGAILTRQGQRTEAHACLERALALLRESRDTEVEGITLHDLGQLFLEEHRLDEAREVLAQGEALLRTAGVRVELGKLLCTRARLERETGDPATASALLDEVESLAGELGTGPDSALGRLLAQGRKALAG